MTFTLTDEVRVPKYGEWFINHQGAIIQYLILDKPTTEHYRIVRRNQ